MGHLVDTATASLLWAEPDQLIIITIVIIIIIIYIIRSVTFVFEPQYVRGSANKHTAVYSPLLIKSTLVI